MWSSGIILMGLPAFQYISGLWRAHGIALFCEDCLRVRKNRGCGGWEGHDIKSQCSRSFHTESKSC